MFSLSMHLKLYSYMYIYFRIEKEKGYLIIKLFNHSNFFSWNIYRQMKLRALEFAYIYRVT